jgi:hypothetical protein
MAPTGAEIIPRIHAPASGHGVLEPIRSRILVRRISYASQRQFVLAAVQADKRETNRTPYRASQGLAIDFVQTSSHHERAINCEDNIASVHAGFFTRKTRNHVQHNQWAELFRLGFVLQLIKPDTDCAKIRSN